jgi:hypothetical protein
MGLLVEFGYAEMELRFASVFAALPQSI